MMQNTTIWTVRAAFRWINMTRTAHSSITASRNVPSTAIPTISATIPLSMNITAAPEYRSRLPRTGEIWMPPHSSRPSNLPCTNAMSVWNATRTASLTISSGNTITLPRRFVPLTVNLSAMFLALMKRISSISILRPVRNSSTMSQRN